MIWYPSPRLSGYDNINSILLVEPHLYFQYYALEEGPWSSSSPTWVLTLLGGRRRRGGSFRVSFCEDPDNMSIVEQAEDPCKIIDYDDKHTTIFNKALAAATSLFSWSGYEKDLLVSIRCNRSCSILFFHNCFETKHPTCSFFIFFNVMFSPQVKNATYRNNVRLFYVFSLVFKSSRVRLTELT